jgi:dephospho-CoA kinase
MEQKDYLNENDRKNRLETINATSRILLVGLTGGIATGKSTVANMLGKMGAHTIDFDLLARRVVETGRPAWKAITEYFGEEILQNNGEIDRKMLSQIVFRDSNKRKKLEGFIYPHLAVEFIDEVCEIASSYPVGIIQAVVPLLLEAGMQDQFHKTVLVYAPREKQIERLIKRDGITFEHAVKILRSQMDIDEKTGAADFVIHNDKSLEETKTQVNELWHKLTDLQKMKHGTTARPDR